jgi:hypothetical protein
MVLGYTRSGLAVLLPTSRVDDAGFAGWSRGDHVDAARILAEHSERERDPEVGPWCKQWSKAHKELGKSSRKQLLIRGGAETVIRSIGRRR